MSEIFPSILVTLTCTGPKPDSIESPLLVTDAELLDDFVADGVGEAEAEVETSG